ncbi:MAG: hypothetical protein AAFR09_03575 [Pseudomonadota bacterium]
MSKRTYLLLLAALILLALQARAGDSAQRFAHTPNGAWLLEVSFPAGTEAPPPFRETLTFHAFGTVTESNTALNANSYNPALGQGCGFTGPGGALEFNCNGSDGTGSWRRTSRNTIAFTVLKFVYDGATNAHVGYLRVTSRKVTFGRDGIAQSAEDSLTEFLVGTDLETAVAIPFGGANARGIRVH